MPELPEVRVVSRTLQNLLRGLTIKKVSVFREKIIKEITVCAFKKQLQGQTFVKVENIGKFIVFHFDSDLILLSHLRMEGKYFFYNQHAKIAKNVHMVIQMTNKAELHFKDTRIFGTFHIRSSKNFKQLLPIKKMAAEPSKIKPSDLHKKLARKRLAIKSSLLDQTILAGLGNIYVDETLFSAQIHPLTPSNKISYEKVKKILKKARKITNKATKMGGTTIRSFATVNSVLGSYQNKLKVHTRKGRKCFKCKSVIEKIKVNGRGTYFCPKCQTLKN